MIDLKHVEALKKNALELNKKNIHLNAQLNLLVSDHADFKEKVKERLEFVMRIYDDANENVLKELKNMHFPEDRIKAIEELFPKKLGQK